MDIHDDSVDNFELCPHCEHTWDGYECEVCGFSDFLMREDYETPTGAIAHCTEDEAFEQGYIYNCPVCQDHIITWWEMEDHGKCINCWHSQNMVDKLKD